VFIRSISVDMSLCANSASISNGSRQRLSQPWWLCTSFGHEPKRISVEAALARYSPCRMWISVPHIPLATTRISTPPPPAAAREDRPRPPDWAARRILPSSTPLVVIVRTAPPSNTHMIHWAGPGNPHPTARTTQCDNADTTQAEDLVDSSDG
jgi:hypothetical protein